MKYIKSFEKVKRIFNVGDLVIWNHADPIMISKKLGVTPYTNAEYGDLCEITQVKGEKGKLHVKLFNKDKKKYVNKLFDSRSRSSIYNPSGHWFEISNFDWNITKPENFKWDIFKAIQYKKSDIVKKLLNNIDDIDIIDNRNSNIKLTPLLLAGFIDNLEIIELLINAGASWNKKYGNSEHDFFYFMSEENKKSIIKKYPEKYDKYLIIKNSEKYNL